MSDLSICRICLRTECKVIKFDRFQLKSYYEEVMALKVNENDVLPPYVCYECAMMLHKFHMFKEKCYCGHKALREILWRGPITYETVYKVDRKARNLQSSLEIMTVTDRVQSYTVIEPENEAENQRDVENASPHTTNQNSDSRTSSPMLVFIDVNNEIVQLEDKKINEQKSKDFELDVWKDKSSRRTRYLDARHWKKCTLTEEQALKEFRERAEDPKYLEASYKCKDCFKGFSKKEMLSRHLQLRHDESLGGFSCRVCRARFRWGEHLRAHLQQHFTEYRCLRCAFVCNLEISALLHEEYHSGVATKCIHCGEEFRCDLNANELADKAPPIPVSETPRKRKRSTSEDSHKAKQAKSDHSLNRSPLKLEREIARNLLQSGTEDKKEKKTSPQKKTVKVRGEKEEKIVQSLLQTISSEDNVKQKITKPGPRRLKDKENIVQDTNISTENTVKPKARKEEVSDKKSSSSENTAKKEEKSDETRSKEGRRGKIVSGKEEEKFVPCLLESSSSADDLCSSETQPKSKPQSDSDTDSSSESSTARKPECKELVIEDRDVTVRRRFLARAVGAGELQRSSRSSEIKPQIHRPAEESSRDTTDSEPEVKQHIKRHLERRASARINPKEKQTKETESIVVESDRDENIGKRRLSLRGKNKPVVLSDESVERNKKKAGDDESVVISDGSAKKTTTKDPESDSNTDDNDKRPARRTRSEGPEKRVREHRKPIDSSDSDSAEDIRKASNSDDDNARPTRRTRSQGPEKKELREPKKTLIISDLDSNEQDIRKTRAKPKEPENKMNKAIEVSDRNSNTDTNQSKKIRTRSKGPEQNRKNDDGEKENDKKTIDDKSTESKKITRSSMKIADVKETQAVPSKKGQVSASSEAENEAKRKEKPGPSKIDKESKKAESEKGEDKSVIYLQKKLPRNTAGRFKKQEDINQKQEKVKDKELDKANDKNRIDNTKEVDERNKVLRDRIYEDRNEKGKNKGSDKKTENRGKENSKKAVAARSMFFKPVKFKKSSVANGREYTLLEDHAIVAWVSVGNRDKMVNGNIIWKELQSEYTRLTSRTRSWHSLRNRYLRYILPSLGQLALPPAQVSRLRAAAAVGKIKTKIHRRNSIFKAPRVFSAATVGRLRFRPPSGSESDSPDTEKKEPTPPSPSRAPAACPSPRARRLTRSSNAGASSPKKRRIHHI